MKSKIETHDDLEVFRKSLDAAMKLFEISKQFPKEETYALTDQMRRSSRSVSANLAEAWRKRRYRAAFISKLSDAEAEAAETQVWITFAVKCRYVPREDAMAIFKTYDEIVRMIVSMICRPDAWLVTPKEGF